MLDSDAPSGATPESTETTPAPRRRRRAATRPAGPPAPVTPPEPAAEAPVEPAAVALPAAEEPVAVQPLDEEPIAEELVTEVAAEEGETAEELAAAAEPQEGLFPEAPDTLPAVQPELEADVPLELVAETPAGEPSTDEVVPEAKTRKRAAARGTRSRRSRKRAEPDADAAEATEAGTAADVGASLAELTAALEQQEHAEEVRDDAEVSAALDDLAAAIGGEPPEADEDAAAESEVDDDADEDDAAPRRRRRRRGGRRRRRGADHEDSDEDDAESGESEEGSDAEPGEDAAGTAQGDSPDTDDSDEAGESPSTSSRRRRRRRRRGEDTGAAEEDGVDVVIKVREPRRSKSANDEITGIEGSTRMEAKRQRRREGRAAGRRRSPILSEAEFLARREALDRQMLIRQAEDYTQIAVLEDGILVEHYVDRDSSASLIGNIYLGRVQNVLPSMEAAFVDIGRGRNAVIYAGEVDWDAYGVTGEDRRIEKVLKSGQTILVQVTKDPIGAKGARLTGHISIPGRYVVYCPGGQLSGISRKLPESERNRLKGILDAAVGEKASVIVRTAAEGASQEELERDVHRLQAQWDIIEKKVKAGSAPQQLYAEPDLTVRIVRDLFTEDFSALVVEGNGQGEDAWDTVEGYVTHVAPHLGERLRRWDRAAEGDLFDKFRVNEQVAKALERKVHLPSGGSLIIDRTEAMTVIDVNTGKFTGTQGNLEATVTSNNLEAAEEIVRQLRLRDIGGIIVIDFIDMVLPANRELLLRRLVESLGRDRTRHQVAEVTSLGLVQMTRKRIGTGLAEAFTVQCETCKGRGYHVHDAPVASQAPSDGGDRDHGRRGGRARSGRSRKGEAKSQESHDQGASTEHAGGESASTEAASA